MAETEWPEIKGKELEYGDHTWELTGTVDVGNTGEIIAVEAKQTDDVRQRNAMLRFGLGDQSASLNPGNPRSRFHGFEQEGDTQYLLVKAEPKVYRYEIQGISYE
ncbi:hypothetical protein CV102_22070 [Natronococcus pandeyae]|uniref:Uncharacterized protein n=1 Tax=Natronococcus pandeyae TaxID=2055836 RepID=A0A8J8PZH6_9EURY|nr:hypothetical protein [Natronococcus pandeyae]TYL36512.1 hypothetical protein CV102_22070 [Natronococcus pandeyae]